MSITTVTNENFKSEVMESDKTVLIDFWAEWCGPCKMLSPLVDEIANERNDIKVCKVNIDEESTLAEMFQIMSIPTLLVIKDGQTVNKSIGVVPKDDILKLL